MKKLVIFANEQFKEFLFAEIKDKKYPYLKEIPKNRINLSNGTRYTFEILEYSSNVETELKSLRGQMQVLNICNLVQSKMNLY
ncbi:hypothetical protein [Acinetobacter baumannii]|uniref:hypothetical protein n=1 Tax=Acinetobacter baumannii TaxID=470 RepID=UPI001F1588C6|nr:hypothetical protein [Acinetobacter baumannii]MCF7213986.1 hypothetical protein [Acinetobacter baumannii]